MSLQFLPLLFAFGTFTLCLLALLLMWGAMAAPAEPGVETKTTPWDWIVIAMSVTLALSIGYLTYRTFSVTG